MIVKLPTNSDGEALLTVTISPTDKLWLPSVLTVINPLAESYVIEITIIIRSPFI